MSKIEKELLGATKLKVKKGEERQAYLVRLCKAVAKVNDDTWEQLSTEAQEWNNGAAEQIKAGDKLDDFPDLDAVEADEEERPLPPPARSAKKDDKPEKKATPAKAASGRKPSACHTIKTLVVKNPKITVAELSDQLKSLDLKVSDVTVATLRSDMRDTLRVMNEVGAGTFEL